jgi:hypothetical protein
VSHVSKKGNYLALTCYLQWNCQKNLYSLDAQKWKKKGEVLKCFETHKNLFWHLGAKTTNNINYPKKIHGFCHGTSVSFGLSKVPLCGKFKQNREW